MTVYIPSQLRSYTDEAQVEATGATLGDVLGELDRRYPGLRFRIIDEQDQVREHIRIFVNGEQVLDLVAPTRSQDEVRIVGALSGG